MPYVLGGDTAGEGVLIETYWNVNSNLLPIPAHLPSRLNRNILECKLNAGGALKNAGESLNRNILECK